MVAPRRTKRIVCKIVRVQETTDSFGQLENRRLGQSRFSTRPSELLPWADPYIARLVTKLQDEVRNERSHTSLAARSTAPCLAELEPPSPVTDHDWDWQDEPNRSAHEQQ